MESGFVSDFDMGTDSDWQPIPHRGSGHFEFFKVRHFGALLFAKRPTAAFRHDLVTIESLKKEFFIGFNLNHPSIVKYVKMEDGVVFEEYVDGVSLSDMIESKDIRLRSPKFLEKVCHDLLKAVAYLHSKGVIHNDIKLENVMISRIDNQIKIVDLGAATSDMWDATGGFTPAYRAPEQGVAPTNVYTDIFLVGRLMEQLVPIAGVKQLWRKFIKKSTCQKVYGRFYSAQVALAAIPNYQRSQRVKLIVGALVIISILFGSLVNSFRNDEPETNINVEAKNVESGKPISISTEKEQSGISMIPSQYSEAVEGGKDLIDQANEAIFNEINTKVNRYAANQFKKLVFPKCRVFAIMPEGPDKDKFGESIDSVIKNVISDVYDVALKSAEPYGENVYYYYALSCIKSSMEVQYDIADSIKYSAPIP